MCLKMYKKEESFYYQTLFVFKNFLIFNFFYGSSSFFKYSNNNNGLFNYSNLFKSLFLVFFWLKLRIVYYVNNWIYTTNHKRIAVNYFWFVILSGIVGMVLATLIRLEFAYPGVGVFAGDSIQYLSLATAHAVVMVFFMIMPLLFGAFANFLLPTQLGVHDVAFPRLNSAAFWFLPGGLLMLCQLVCVDRRYQRMNCFNIREVQSLLKRKFFTDLINTHDHRTLLDKTVLGLRYKTNTINLINSNVLNFYNYGIELTPKIRVTPFFNVIKPLPDANFLWQNPIFLFLLTLFKNTNILNVLSYLYIYLFSPFSYFAANSPLFTNFNFNFSINSSLLTDLKSIDFQKLWTRFTDFCLSVLYSSISYLNFFFTNSWSDLFYFFLVKYCGSGSPIPLYYYYYTLSFRIWWLNLLFGPYEVTLTSTIIDSFGNSYTMYRNVSYLISHTDFKLYYNYLVIYLNFINTYLLSVIYHYLHFINFDIIDFGSIRTFLNLLFHRYSEKLNTNRTFFKVSFFSNLDYSSRFVYLYFLLYFFINLPLILLDFFKNIFIFENYLITIGQFYNFFSNWYITFLIDNNLFELLVDRSGLSFNDFISIFFKVSTNFISTHALQLVGFFSLQTLSDFYIINLNSVSSFFEKTFVVFHIFLNILNNLIFGLKTHQFFTFLINNDNLLIIFRFHLNPYFRINYSSDYFSNANADLIQNFSNEELSSDSRFNRFSNPVFKYDYKSGDYFPKLYKEVYLSLFTTISDITGGLRTSPWFLSEKYQDAFNTSFSNYLSNVRTLLNEINLPMHTTPLSKFSNTDGFYNFFYLLSSDYNLINRKWVSSSNINQKFYKMFNSNSMQQRVYSNWRQLKFTREAWRCKLLAARHQKTLFKRYVHEDGVFWSIERNAKDLLPGWAMITPFSSRTRFTAVGKTDIGLMGVLLVLNSSLISGANFLVTYRYLSTLNNRKMRDARAFFTEGIMVASWMMIAANPMLVIGIIMLLSDRHWQTSFFDYSGGGDTVLFQHMFWFFGHPEVYVIIIPTFGFTNTMLSYYLKKRVSARASLLYSMYTIAFLGFFVWGHHMYMVGLAHTTRMLFSTLTVMISVPAATKIMHWCVTIVNSSFATELPLLFIMTFIFFFVSGGISGMCVAHTGMDVLFHDTFYVIGHFHVMLAGAAMFSSFGAFYFYFPAIFGVKYSRIYAYLHYSYYLLGQLMTVIPMFWLGYAGMPRRVLDYPSSMGGWHSVISAGHMLSVAGLIAFFIMIFDSLRQSRAVIRNTFGISRYNTRLNFYLYEIARLAYIQQKGLSIFRFTKPSTIRLGKFNYFNFEPYETTLISYTFLKNK